MTDPRIDETPDTLNERLLNATLRRHVQVLRLETSVARRIVTLIKALDREIEAELAARIGRLSPRDREELATRQTFTTRRLQALRRTLENQRKAIESALRQGILGETDGLARFEAEASVRALQAAFATVSLDIITPEIGLLNSIARSRPLQGKHLREWTQNWSRDKRSRTLEQIRLGVIAGENENQIGRRIRQVHQTKRHHANAIARTAVASIITHAQRETAQANDDVVKSMVWVATLDHSTCFEGSQEIETPSGPIRIDALQVGDKVMGGSGVSRDVLATRKIKADKLLQIKLSNGKVLRCTPDHLLLDDSGKWVKAGELANGSRLSKKMC